MTGKRIVHVYDEQGRRLLTLPQFAEALGINTALAWQRRRRGILPEPAGWLDERTPLWHSPTDT